MSSATALDRLERVLVMVPWLLNHPGATFAEIASLFGGTPQDIADDLDILGYCGLPGYGGGDLIEVTTKGDAVTVRLAEYFDRPLRLSLREAVTMLLAARAWAQVGAHKDTESDALQRATQRLEVLIEANAAGPDAALASARVAIDVGSAGDHLVASLRAAIAQDNVVRMVYRSASKAETTTREVEPWSVVGARGSWYLRGYCRLAQGHRDFRLDRIAELDILDEHTTRPQVPLAPVGYQPASSDHEVVVELRRPSWWVIEELAVDSVDETGEWRTVQLRTGEVEWLARRLLSLGSDARVHQPRQLVRRMQTLAKQMRALYHA